MKDTFLNLGFKGKSNVANYLFTLGLAIGFYFLGQLPLLIASIIQMNRHPEIGMEELALFEKNMDFSQLIIGKNLGFILLLATFIFGMVGLLIGLKLQDKTIKDLVAARKIDFKRIAFGFGVWMVLFFIFEVIIYFTHPTDYKLTFTGWSFVGLIAICIILLPIQTSFEELLFRGHIMQGVFQYSKNRWLAVLVSSILFSLVHSFNPEIARYGFWTMQIYYVGAGLLLGLITVMDDGLELALGVHAATNIFGALFFVYEGSVLQTNALFHVSNINPLLINIIFVIAAVIFYICASQYYKWPPIPHIWQAPIQSHKATNIDQQESTITEITEETKIQFNSDYLTLLNDDDE